MVHKLLLRRKKKEVYQAKSKDAGASEFSNYCGLLNGLLCSGQGPCLDHATLFFIQPCSHAIPHHPIHREQAHKGTALKRPRPYFTGQDQTSSARGRFACLFFPKGIYVVVAQLVETRRHRFQKPVFPPHLLAHTRKEVSSLAHMSSERARGRGGRPLCPSPLFPSP